MNCTLQIIISHKNLKHATKVHNINITFIVIAKNYFKIISSETIVGISINFCTLNYIYVF